jgi:ribosomal protein S12 methylthiotransferase
MTKKVHLVSLGCARNRVDSEVMLGTLLGQGWSHTEAPGEAQAIIINTCGFIESAKEESIDHILEAADWKKTNPDLKLVVAGCLTQRYKKQLVQGLPEVDLFVGTDEFSKIGEFLESPQEKGALFAKRTHYLYQETLPRINTLAKGSAYVKIAEGCQHQCAFCIIPAIRGKLRSRPIEGVVTEVKQLVAQGVKEINLIAQDLAAYGRDKGSDDLLPLLKELVQIEGLQWIRPLYMYPENIHADFMEFFAKESKMVPYLDIPVQHASAPILKAMKRPIEPQELEDRIQNLRKKVPHIAIRTSVMVGFPGETEEDFQVLFEFVKKMKFDHLGCFTYSKEEGTVAGRMENQIPEEIKEARKAKIMELQRGISAQRLKSYVGQVLPVLLEGPSQEHELLWQGRLPFQAPEVDGVVYINDGSLEAGQIKSVMITESHDYDLVGHVLT